MKNQKEQIGLSCNGISRRQFIGSSIAPVIGLGLYGQNRLFASEPSTSEKEVKIKEYRTLGRTGFKASNIGLGSGEITDTDLLEAILDTGINYIDTAENYGRGKIESTIGKVIKNRERKSVFISTKLELRGDLSKEAIIKRARKCLERLQSDYIDCLMIHCPATVEELKTEGFHEATRELKAEGRVRFCGLSNHGAQWQDVSETMEQVLLAAAEDGRFDVMLFVYNFLQRDQGEKVLKACQEKNIGATLMKTNPVANYLEVKEEIERLKEEGKEVPEFYLKLLPRLKKRADLAEPFRKKYNLTNYDEVRNAAIKFVLSNPYVHSACCTIKNYNDLEAFVALSGQRLESAERKKLSAYRAVYGDLYCRHACGICESSCPHGVPVNTIMRYQHYFKAQGREKTAMVKYAALQGNKADNCSDCNGYCEQACPYKVPIQALLTMAHQTLTVI